MTLTSSEPAIHPEGNAIFGYDGGNHFARKKGPSEGCLLLRAPIKCIVAKSLNSDKAIIGQT